MKSLAQGAVCCTWGDGAGDSYFPDRFMRSYGLAGAPGFEPRNGGIEIRCLTTRLRPNQARGPYTSIPIRAPKSYKGWYDAAILPFTPLCPIRPRGPYRPGAAPI